ncbi:MAG: DUF371 domain-containing protein [Nitrososphaerales archaeon]
MEEVIEFYGHPLIRAEHKSTFELTKEDFLTERGDCIIGVKANKACKDLKEEIKEKLKEGKRVEITVKVDKKSFFIRAKGDERLTFKNSKSIVVRRSKFICTRTLAIEADKAAKDFPREMIELLKEGKKGSMIIKIL